MFFQQPDPEAGGEFEEVQLELPPGRLRVTFEDGDDGVSIDTVHDQSPCKGLVRKTHPCAFVFSC